MTPRIKRIWNYACHYGIRSAAALFFEKYYVDKRRFSSKAAPALTTEGSSSCLPQACVCEVGRGGRLPLRVLFALHYFYPERSGGTERFTLNLALGMKERGITPIVLVLDANLSRSAYTESIGDILFREYEYLGIKCIGFRHKRAPIGLYYKNLYTEDEGMRALLRLIIRREGIELFHATYPQPFLPMLDECSRLGLPYVVTCTDFCMICPYATMVDRNGELCRSSQRGERCAAVCKPLLCKDHGKRYELSRAALSSAAAVTVPSDFVNSLLSRELSINNVLTVNHGIGEEFRTGRRRERVRRFLFAGTLTRMKGAHLLISAFQRLKGEYELIIAGDGDKRYIRSLRLERDSRIRYIGAVPQEKMPELYSSVDCVVVPSMWQETYNFVLREAASTGALVVAARLGAMPEAMIDGATGFLFEPCSEDSLLEALERAVAFDPTRRQIPKYPLISDEIDTYLNIYSQAVSGKNE